MPSGAGVAQAPRPAADILVAAVRLAVEVVATPRAPEEVLLAAEVIPEVATGAQVFRRPREKQIALLTDQDSVRPSAISWASLPLRNCE